ncbi:serine hydrolase domain-containing protein [Arenibaculum pallidiluteum]|uniref:serine hydrolase domain-containing protein n=1 Tax=Arenibaculum pallidiluteum TaxID=2812559 RepID=UPI001A970384|nr:serine hydrolase domain-containing protein [Arenibaculum pallidiluteum]
MTLDRRDVLRITGLGLLAGTALGRITLGRTAQAQDGNGRLLRDALDGALGTPVRRGDIPGVVAAVTDRSQIRYVGAFGERALGKGVAMTPDTVFNIASMTKPVTSTAAMQLVEQGRLDLDSPISRWIPGAARLQVLEGWDANGEPRLRPARREITLRHLMTHSSGFAYNLWDPELDRFMKQRRFPELASGQEAAWYPPLMFDPGERWEYGISTDWIGKLVETASGKTLGTYMQENIFWPLGMESTGYRLTPDMEARRAATHQRGPDGRLTEIAWNGQTRPVPELGGGGLHSTVGDYARFVRMILNGGRGNDNQLLRPQTVELMSRNAMGNIRVSRLGTTNPSRSEDAEFFPGLPKTWSLGFMINEATAPTGRPAGSLAWAGLYNTFFWIDRRNEIGGIFMTQVLPFVDAKTLAAFYGFETAVYQAMGPHEVSVRR